MYFVWKVEVGVKTFMSPLQKKQKKCKRCQYEQKKRSKRTKCFGKHLTIKDFIDQKTNCTVLQNPKLEADDLIAGWVQAHPNDNHFIISTDGDFAQLIAPNVAQYNGVQEVTITHPRIL